jgi:cytochrome o ubiquinol oxidase subunit 3
MNDKPIFPQPITASPLSAAPRGAEEERTHKDATTVFGFWMYLMTDFVLFASLFAVYAVLRGGTGLGPSGAALFDRPYALIETLILLTSSFACGLALLAARARKKGAALFALSLTGLLGLAFIGMELSEFARFVAAGHGWQQSGFLSAYFVLVGTHGLHIIIGLLWLIALLISVARAGFTRGNLRKLLLWSFFWHFLDLVWIFIFTLVYLMAV